ncbi:uncharacterized protein OCT59_000660 [Rhizophagus irregularis]|uniref:uncharacterized protein n=1 Tax=Rhizophagus irregularis TaxID=588596 RepID=UPI00332F29DE|nr:hypothetical protein OCT59_000660 [Rhizophagus irregularis]
MLEHLGTEDLSNSDYEQHTDTSSSSDGNESDDGTFADTFENYLPPDFKSYQEKCSETSRVDSRVGRVEVALKITIKSNRFESS